MVVKQVSHIIADYILFIDTTGEDELAPDTAVNMMEALRDQLAALDKGFLRELVDALGEIATDYSGEAQELVRDIPYSFHLEDALATDGPVRLAELEAIRDARD